MKRNIRLKSFEYAIIDYFDGALVSKIFAPSPFHAIKDFSMDMYHDMLISISDVSYQMINRYMRKTVFAVNHKVPGWDIHAEKWIVKRTDRK